ncbi:arginine--tRNA ligase [Thermodesulfitimonas autotrophica]|uniref:arginine--tRNA ligase n=1 Tax=Thermodesulfitimonas autotrophica TaxID=1894989 RepID=UPI002FE3C367
MEALKSEIRAAITRALQQVVETVREELNLPEGTAVPDFTVESPREEKFGDFSANVALQLAKPARRSPREVASLIRERWSRELCPWVEKVEVAGPGFLNFYLRKAWLQEALREVVYQGEDYGRSQIGGGRKVNVEFVSANPTGLLHMGNARGAALGDSIAALLAFCGFDVTREFYINDTGYQIERFAASLEARYFQQFGENVPVPEDGYHGRDLIATAQRFIAATGTQYRDVPAAVRREALARFGVAEKIAAIRQALENFGVRYDVWFSEEELHKSGAVERVIKELTARGATYELDGALWFKARDYGAAKDEVLIRSTGAPTYFAADIAYHVNKLERGFVWLINIWGADHHGHVPRLKAALKALGADPDCLQVVIMQLVRLFRGGEIVRMSKRTGEFVTLEELLEEVGRDAARYFFVLRGADSHLDFDLDLARAQSLENPVYYVQYAHARIASIFRQLADRGIPLPDPARVDLSLLATEEEERLMKQLAAFPEEVADAALGLAPHRLTGYIYDLAGLFHSFYNVHRVIGAGPGLEEARIVLVQATGIVLRQGLRLLGVRAPERM